MAANGCRETCRGPATGIRREDGRRANAEGRQLDRAAQATRDEQKAEERRLDRAAQATRDEQSAEERRLDRAAQATRDEQGTTMMRALMLQKQRWQG